MTTHAWGFGLAGELGNAGFAIPGFAHFVADAAQQIAEDLPIVLLVLDDKYALAHAFPA